MLLTGRWRTRWATVADWTAVEGWSGYSRGGFHSAVNGFTTHITLVEPEGEFFSEREVVGFMAVKPGPIDDVCGLKITHLMVHPDHTHQGVGRMLLLAAEERRRLISPNSRYVQFDVPEQCVDLQCFLRACGWRATSMGGIYRFLNRS